MANQNPIITFLTKNKIASILIAVILVLVIGTLSVQAFAPNNFKIFKTAKSESSSSSSSESSSSSNSSSSNSSSSSSSSSISSSTSSSSSVSSTTSSIAIFPEDPNYAVVTSSKCDLSVRYNKITNDKGYLLNNGNFPIIGRLYDSEDFLVSIAPPIEAIQIELDTAKLPNAATGSFPGFNVSCYGLNINVQEVNRELAETELVAVTANKDSFCKEILLTSISCSKITNIQKYIGSSYGLESNYFFDYSNKKYRISNYSDIITPAGLSLHFTSLGKV